MSPVVFRAGGRRAVHLLLLTGSLILGALWLEAIDANAATPSSLAGETFISNNVKGSTFTGACPDDLTGTNGSFNFSVSGTAAGPFPGTFTESGSITTSLSGHVLTFASSFTIKDTAGTITVTGTKGLPTGSTNEVECSFAGPGGTEVMGSIGANYRATIPGVGRDSGTATVSINDNEFGSVVQLLSFSENFGSAGAGQQQCEHGGWKSFGNLFRNQGDCVSFLATHGKNPPAGL